VLAPSNSALDAIPEPDRTAILNDQALAQQFVRGHILSTPMTAQQLADAQTVQTAGGQELTISGTSITGPSGTASITAPDQACVEGFVHGIDGVLFVPVVEAPAPPTEPPTEPPTGT
jgi:uncharacterized surface protein with fasciclin (FAS1) repeats